jgi:hypothetical protein
MREECRLQIQYLNLPENKNFNISETSKIRLSSHTARTHRPIGFRYVTGINLKQLLLRSKSILLPNFYCQSTLPMFHSSSATSFHKSETSHISCPWPNKICFERWPWPCFMNFGKFKTCIGSIYYRQHNKQLVIMVLQRHVSTHMSHRQVTFRTFRF